MPPRAYFQKQVFWTSLPKRKMPDEIHRPAYFVIIETHGSPFIPPPSSILLLTSSSSPLQSYPHRQGQGSFGKVEKESTSRLPVPPAPFGDRGPA